MYVYMCITMIHKHLSMHRQIQFANISLDLQSESSRMQESICKGKNCKKVKCTVGQVHQILSRESSAITKTIHLTVVLIYLGP